MACWPGGAAADTPSIAKHPCGGGKEEEVKASKTEFFLDSASLSTNNDGPSAKERGSLNQSYPPLPPPFFDLLAHLLVHHLEQGC